MTTNIFMFLSMNWDEFLQTIAYDIKISSDTTYTWHIVLMTGVVEYLSIDVQLVEDHLLYYGIMKRHGTFLYKNIYRFLLLFKRSKILQVWDKRQGHSLAEAGYIDLFLTHVVIPYSGPYVSASLTRSSRPGSARAAAHSLQVAPSVASALTLLWIYLADCDSMTDWVSVYI